MAGVRRGRLGLGRRPLARVDHSEQALQPLVRHVMHLDEVFLNARLLHEDVLAQRAVQLGLLRVRRRDVRLKPLLAHSAEVTQAARANLLLFASVKRICNERKRNPVNLQCFRIKMTISFALRNPQLTSFAPQHQQRKQQQHAKRQRL